MVDVDITAGYLREPAAKVNWLDPKVCGPMVLFCTHQVSWETLTIAVP